MNPHALPLFAALVAAILAGACSTGRVDVPPEARACASSRPLPRMSDESERLSALRTRADEYGECMQARGFVLDEEALDAELLRFEQIRNAERYGVDPRMAIDIREQQLRLSPAYWKRSGPRQQP